MEPLSKAKRTAVKDFFYTAIASGHDPFPVTSDRVITLETEVAKIRPTGAHQRALAWRVALDALSERDRQQCGITAPLTQPRGKRLRNESRNTFVALERDVEVVAAEASRPITGDTDTRNPVKYSCVIGHGERMQIMASALFRNGIVTRNVALQDLLTPDMLARYLDIIDAADSRAGTRTYVAGECQAVRFFAVRVCGAATPEARFAFDQQKIRVAPGGLSDKRVLLLTRLTQPKVLRQIAGVVDHWWAVTTDPTRPRTTRLRYCNLACAYALQMQLLLRPVQLATLQFDNSGSPILKTKRTEALGPILLTPGTTKLLEQRRILRKELGAADSDFLFPSADSDDGAQTSQSLCMSLAKALKPFPDLRGLTAQVMRDVGAVMLLRNDPRAIRRVAALLDVGSKRVVEQRYRPFLTGAA